MDVIRKLGGLGEAGRLFNLNARTWLAHSMASVYVAQAHGWVWIVCEREAT